jgi:hypothetical protein
MGEIPKVRSRTRLVTELAVLAAAVLGLLTTYLVARGSDTNALRDGVSGVGVVAVTVGPVLAGLLSLVITFRTWRESAKRIRPAVHWVADAAWAAAMSDREVTPDWRGRRGGVMASQMNIDVHLDEK